MTVMWRFAYFPTCQKYALQQNSHFLFAYSAFLSYLCNKNIVAVTILPILCRMTSCRVPNGVLA